MMRLLDQLWAQLQCWWSGHEDLVCFHNSTLFRCARCGRIERRLKYYDP